MFSGGIGPFNYSAVNNLAASHGRGDVLVFLNDDTEVRDPSWLRELVGWAMQPDVGMVGLRLTGQDGKIQHEGVIVGMSGFADHVFAGMPPGSDSIYGPTDRLRDVLAVTGACSPCAVLSSTSSVASTSGSSSPDPMSRLA